MTEARKFPEPQAYEDADRPQITLHPVDSSQVKAIGYDGDTKTLAVQFNHGAGAIYHYHNVEPDLYHDFMVSESKGKFHGQRIKQLPFKKYRAETAPA